MTESPGIVAFAFVRVMKREPCPPAKPDMNPSRKSTSPHRSGSTVMARTCRNCLEPILVSIFCKTLTEHVKLQQWAATCCHVIECANKRHKIADLLHLSDHPQREGSCLPDRAVHATPDVDMPLPESRMKSLS